jgi:hypothetical protein
MNIESFGKKREVKELDGKVPVIDENGVVIGLAASEQEWRNKHQESRDGLDLK